MSKSDRVPRLVLLAVAAIAPACVDQGVPDLDLPREVTDTGYQGTWQRGNERVRSTLSIVELDGEFRFRYTLMSNDAKRKVVGNWDGKSEEFVDGEKSADYSFRTWIDPETGLLRVECTGRVLWPTPRDVHYIDELRVRRKGLKLRSYTLEDDNGVYEPKEGPRRDFEKISDHVIDPPDGWSPPSRRAGNPRP